MSHDHWRPSWRLKSSLSELIVSPRTGANDEALEHRVHPNFAAGEVERWFAEEETRLRLMEIFDYLTGYSATGHARPIDEMRSLLIPAVEGALRSGRLVAAAPARGQSGALRSGAASAAQAAEQAPAAAPAPARKRDELTWVSIELVDEQGREVPYERFRLIAADGTVREGQLDEMGLASVHGIVPGACRVTFLDLEDEAWSPA